MGLRARISPRLTDDGLIEVAVEWVEVDEASNHGEVKLAEQFRMSPAKGAAGCKWFSRLTVHSGNVQPGTFWTDEAGRRHFVVNAEPGTMQAIGQELR